MHKIIPIYTFAEIEMCRHIYAQRNKFCTFTHPTPAGSCIQGGHTLPQAQICTQAKHTHAYTNIYALQGRYFPCTCTHNLCMQIGFSERSNSLLTLIKTKQR